VILVDSSVLVALCDRSDPLAGLAKEELRSLRVGQLRVTSPVLTETWHLLGEPWLRKILIHWLTGSRVPISCPVEERGAMGDVWRWLEKYGDQDPDFTDAYLVIASADKRSSVWTFDGEFAEIWRHLDGSRIKLTFPPV
jgi:predicted nucleic acid-binding protein